MISIGPASPLDPDVTRLIRASHALMDALFPAESNHHMSPDALAGPDVRVFAARRDGAAVGCAALALRDGYGEVKSMFVDPGARGGGIAQALMRQLEATARAEDLLVIRLETGDRLTAARRLYAAEGYCECPPFGAYAADPLSVFMEKRL